MKRNLIMLVVVGVVAAVLAVLYQLMPERLTPEMMQEAALMQKKVEEANAPQKDAAQPEMKPVAEAVDDAAKTADNVFKVKFECSNGTFVVEVHRDWAPVGVRRFEELLKANFYNENRFFRVVPDFVVQFGLSGDPKANAQWGESQIVDDPRKESNLKGYVTFATSGPNSRTTQLFISLKDNPRLDGMGFAPFGKVIEGMEVVEKINPEYGENAIQGVIRESGNEYLQKFFPNMDYIKTVTRVP